MNKYRHDFPDKAGCRKQLERIVMMERQHKQERYMQLYGKMPAEDQLLLSAEDYLYYFGASTQKNMLEPQGLTPTILGAERFYDSFDINFRKHSGVRWTVKYDPGDLSTALAINDDGTLRFLLQEKYRQPMALKERTEGDASQLQAVRDFNRDMENYITDVRANAAEKVRQLFDDTPELNDTLAKMVLIDSHGQHKNQRNNQRLLQSAGKLNKKIITIEAKEANADFIAERQEYVRSKVDLSKYLEIETA